MRTGFFLAKSKGVNYDLANGFFSLGYVMWLHCNNWLKSLIFIFPFILFSDYSYSAPRCWSWSTIGGSKHPSENPSSIKTKCKLNFSGSASYTCGNTSAQTNTEIIETDDTGMTIHGVWWEPSWLHNGYNQWDKQYNYSYSLSPAQSKTMSSALRKALEADNCDIAGAIFDSMSNPNIDADGDVSFTNGDDACAITKDGTSACTFNKSGLTEDGRPKITICGEQNCDSGTLDEYSSSKTEISKDTPSPPQNGDGQPSDKPPRELRPDDSSGSSSGGGSSGSSSGSGSSGGGSSGGGSSGGDTSGSQGGSGVGNGKGDGEGDEEGDGNSEVNNPQLEDFNLREAISNLKGKLDDIIPKDIEAPSGTCPTVSISIMQVAYVIDAHCQIMDRHGDKLSAVFSLIWAFLAIRILLSA